MASGLLILGALRWRRVRIGLMLASSIVFYLHFGGVTSFAIISLLGFGTYLTGLYLHQTRSTRREESWLRLLLQFVFGILSGLALAMVFYFLTLPAQPFIYVGF